jgi:Pectinacetylesterase
MRRLDVAGVLALLILAAAGPADAKRAVCPDGRFLQATTIVPGGSADGAFDAVVIANGQVSIESGCDATRVHEKGLKDGTTRVRAKWKTCGTLKKVRLAATIVAGDEACGKLVGGLKAKKTDTVPVSATRSACGDGIVDPTTGEQCDPPSATCSAECKTQADTTAIAAPARTWTWVPFSNAYCANGTTTGIGVNPGDAGGRLVIFMMGGGACWDENTCYGLKTASYIDSGYGASQFANDAAALLGATFFNRNDVANPFRNDSFVFVPYCTGDVHAGSKPDAMYGTHPTRHVGFQNMAAYLQRIVPTFGGASRVILSGSSAGGFGALTNWYQTQQAFGSLRVDLLDDSGPPLPAPYLTESLEQTWRNAWNLAAATPAGCTQCATDLDAVIAFYGSTMTGHRAALLSYTQDSVIGLFFQLPGAQVEAGLGALATEMAPFDVWRHFYVTGTTHTIFGSPDTVSHGVSLRTFVTQMVTDDPSWATVEP